VAERELPPPLTGEVHLWYAVPDAIGDPALLAAYDALLAPSERARNRRFVFERHRKQDLVTRALVRTVLSSYCPGVPPAAWTFKSGRFGRPEIAGPAISPTLRFNLSHTDGMVVCLVGDDRELGADVEDVSRNSATVEIADRYFSADEVRELRSWPSERQPDRFFDYWTLKEAYIKARGMGLHLPLGQFTMLPGASRQWAAGSRQEQRIGIRFGPGIHDDPQSWQFFSFDLTPRHRAAVALRRQGADLGLRLFQTVPRPGGHPASALAQARRG
jgi:4'-phosphopantetheinyl transferase